MARESSDVIPPVTFSIHDTSTNVELTGSVVRPHRPAFFEEGECIDEKFIICKKINEGGFGAIYEVTPDNDSNSRYAMKLALMKDSAMDQIVKMEIQLLRRLSNQSVAFPRLHNAGTVKGYRYFVMDLLGPSLADVLLYMPDEKFSTSTVVRIGLQIIDAIEVIHACFFVHRDIKPGNMAIGRGNSRRIHLFDFGLARRFVQRKHGEANKLDFRPERARAPFRGTYHYCSLHQHRFKDAGRRDDLWAFMYTLIEFKTGILPWEHERDKQKIEKIKQKTPISILLQGCPLMFEALLKYLDRLEFKSRPSYDFFRKAFKLIMVARNYKEEGPFDWEIIPRNVGSARKPRSVSQKAVYDRGGASTQISDPTDREDSSEHTVDTNASTRTVE